MLANGLVFLDEDLVLPRGLFVVAPDNELLTSWWLRSEQSCLCDLLQTHSNRQQWLVYTIVELEPVWLDAASVDLSEHLEALVKVESILWLSKDEPHRLALLDGLLNDLHLLRDHDSDDAFVVDGHRDALRPLIVREERVCLHIGQL